jgi:hypothetical protein
MCKEVGFGWVLDFNELNRFRNLIRGKPGFSPDFTRRKKALKDF